MLLLLVILLLAGTADGATYQTTSQGVLLPDPAITPGQARPLDTTVVCTTRWGKDRRHVTSAMKVETYRRYAATKVPKVCCEVDHLVSRELGGADVMENLWPQPWLQARKKDRLENRLHKLVCTGTLALPDVQRRIAQDWGTLYFEVFGEWPR